MENAGLPLDRIDHVKRAQHNTHIYLMTSYKTAAKIENKQSTPFYIVKIRLYRFCFNNVLLVCVETGVLC